MLVRYVSVLIRIGYVNQREEAEPPYQSKPSTARNDVLPETTFSIQFNLICLNIQAFFGILMSLKRKILPVRLYSRTLSAPKRGQLPGQPHKAQQSMLKNGHLQSQNLSAMLKSSTEYLNEACRTVEAVRVAADVAVFEWARRAGAVPAMQMR